MPCYFPLQGYLSKTVNPSGKRSVVFKPQLALDPVVFKQTVSCGRCIGCRLAYSAKWAIRCVHEASLHSDNCFITLTFSDEFLPTNRSLDLGVFQKFMKRLRKRFGSGIRFFHCGEYGSRFGRPHYHACLFGVDFPDKVLFKMSNGFPLYRSSILEKLWKFGHSTVAALTFETAAYTARYILKKVTGDAANDHYIDIDYDTGEVFSVQPEYVTMSNRPGLAKGWIDKFTSDVYPHDFVIINNKKFRPPKFYDSQFELTNPDEFAVVKDKRVCSAISASKSDTLSRRNVKRICKEASISKLVRPLL